MALKKSDKVTIVKRDNYRGTGYYAIYDDEVEATGWTKAEAIKLFKQMKNKHIKVHPSIGYYKHK